MNKKGGIAVGVIFTILITGLVGLVSFVDYKEKKEIPNSYYQVYLDDEIIGVISDREEFLNLVDKEQLSLKRKYGVEKVYPPKGLKIQEVLTYNGDIQTSRYIYNKIKNIKPFTVKGYTITIDRGNNKFVKINVLKKSDFDKAVRNTITSFIKEDTYNKYLNDTQDKITDLGTTIDDVDLKEKITYKEAFLSTDEEILTDTQEVSRYLLFGTLDKQKSYKVKAGETLEEVANGHKLSIEEFLIANPDIPSENTLIFPGQEVNIGLLHPQISVVVTSSIIEEQEVKYKTEEKLDASLAIGTYDVVQKGENGLNKVKIKQETVNGDITHAVIIESEQITPPTNKIVKKGALEMNGDMSGDWGWPTITPYIITSPYGPRWGRMHDGIDISGCGHGSPIYASNPGKVVQSTTAGGSLGTYVLIHHGKGIYTEYAHMSKLLVKIGDTVKRGQVVGLMGSTGRSTGTHLHFAVYKGGYPHRTGQSFNPLTLFK